MPILRLNAGPDGLSLHGSPAAAIPAIRTAAKGTGPVMVLIHGCKYDPTDTSHSPHTSIFGTEPHHHKVGHVKWLRHLGFCTGDVDEGLAIAFAWPARGTLWRAQRAARVAGRHLADVIALLRLRAPNRPIHVISHSMGSEVIFEALTNLPPNAVQRIIALSGASYASRATAAMQSLAGRSAELFNVTSRENDVFDFMFERLIAPPVRGDWALGNGIVLPNAVNIQLDCPRTLAALTRFGGHIASPRRRMCHWSGYTRPGVLRFYAHVLRAPKVVTLREIQQTLPEAAAPRWSRMFARPRVMLSLPMAEKPAS
ncbi:alpha/beta hydrolase [uncultured Tateyamaria sp.]|uniref:alpha/beta hydrolase n=1 Tax=uncultured Tateyamaria sp. TaxID=455651 RepID=UPI0026168751|nr:alpha/beta hydrolase [uncultured Tateyamaria sp.]